MTSSAQLSTQLFCAFTKKRKKEKKKEKGRERKRKSEGLKAVKHHKHGFKTANHHTEYLALILVIKYISHYNHLS